MFLETERLIIRSLNENDIPSLQNYYRRNRQFLQPWEPHRDEIYYSWESLKKMIFLEKVEEKNRKAYRGYIFLKEKQRNIIGFAGLTNIHYSYDFSGRIGYKLDKDHTNRGFMTEALTSLIHFGFYKLSLHRLESHVMPANISSQRVLEKLNFQKEGYNFQFRKINGIWEDHILYALVEPEER